MQEYIKMWVNFLDFDGRAGRRDFWVAAIINFLIAVVLGTLASFIGVFVYLLSLYELAVLIPGLSLSVRRLRDSGHRWYCIFLPFIPLVGSIILLVFLIQPSKWGGGDSKVLY